MPRLQVPLQCVFHVHLQLYDVFVLKITILCFWRCTQRFPLGGDDEVMSSTLQQFAKVIDEVRA